MEPEAGGSLRSTERSALLPPRLIDLMTDGVPPEDLKERGDRAVDHALMSTAMSAVCRGMSEQDWLALVLDPSRRLGRQAERAKGRARTPVEYRMYLARVWERATTQGHGVALRDRGRYREEARRLLERWDAFLPVLAREVDRADGLLIAALLDRIADVESPRVAFPRRAFQEATGLPERQFRTRLTALQTRGVVRLEVRGRPSGPRAKKRLSNVYSLSGPERLATELRITY